MDKALLNVKEFCLYLGIGETKAREILTKTNNNFTVRIGNRLYANKMQLDKWLLNISGNQINKKRRG
jgi:Excisionase from transposon Tn916.